MLVIIHSGSQGFWDVPDLKLIGRHDPSDMTQGEIGDRWFLSAVSALAEFDGAVAQLFRNTPNVWDLPSDRPNLYTVTLYNVQKWEPVDVVVDERLCILHDLVCVPLVTHAPHACRTWDACQACHSATP